MSETTVKPFVCSNCQILYPTPMSFRGRCSAQDCQELICENCWVNGARQCATHRSQQPPPFPRLRSDEGSSIAELAKQGVEMNATEEALGVAMVHAVGQTSTRGFQLLRPEVRSSPDGNSLWLKKKRFFRSALIIEAEYSSSEKGVSGLRDQALRSANNAKAQKNLVLKCFTCPKPSIDMIAFAERFSDAKMALYLMEDTNKVYFNVEDMRAQHFLKLFAPVPINVTKA